MATPADIKKAPVEPEGGKAPAERPVENAKLQEGGAGDTTTEPQGGEAVPSRSWGEDCVSLCSILKDFVLFSINSRDTLKLGWGLDGHWT